VIDIHSHVLPDIPGDDGVETYEEAVDLIRQGYEQGLSGIVATPHVRGEMGADYEAELLLKQSQLQAKLAEIGIDVTVYLGAEIFCDPEALEAVKHQTFTLNGTGKYALVEFPMTSIPSGADELLFQIQLQGVTPIIAHPERNGSIQENPNVLYHFVRRGILSQLTAASLLGFGGPLVQRLSKKLLRHNLVHVIASDAHHPQKRPLILADAKGIAADVLEDEQDADDLFVRNPKLIIEGKFVPTYEPEPIRNSLKEVVKDTFDLIFSRK